MEMSKQNDHKADMGHANKGTPGQNPTHAQNQGNRGGQLNPNNPAKGGKGSKK
jgi:hypothetical protein